METITSKEFFDQINSNSLKQATYLKGIVKKSDDKSELLFTRKGDFKNWIKIPSSIVDSVKVLKIFVKENETFVVVKLQLKTPSTPEGKVLFELLATLEKCNGDNKAECSHCGSAKEGKSCGCSCHHEHHHEAGHYCQYCGCHNSHSEYGAEFHEHKCGCSCHVHEHGNDKERHYCQHCGCQR
jgi:hypothetical protein